MQEEWVKIEEFPRYAVSNFGRVRNLETGQIKIPTANQQGIPSVNLMKDRAQHRRAVAPLVANEFLPPPIRHTFDTPINLDGDRFNNHVDNLLWRPRWFAVKYHAQLKTAGPGYHGALEVVDTGERFMHIRDAATKYGLLEMSVLLSALNDTPVFPTGQRFRRVKQ